MAKPWENRSLIFSLAFNSATPEQLQSSSSTGHGPTPTTARSVSINLYQHLNTPRHVAQPNLILHTKTVYFCVLYVKFFLSQNLVQKKKFARGGRD